jgi:aspartate/glutamate racemase
MIAAVPTLAFIHTSHVLIPLFTELAKKHLPGVEIFHMLDDSLIRNTIRAGCLTENTTRRVAGMIDLAHEGGADVVMVTCSSIGKATELARDARDFPVLRIDEAMAERAVEQGVTIGVAATLSTTLEPTVELLQATADRLGKSISIVSRVAEGAFEAVVAGDVARHDELVLAMLRDLRSAVDVVVLSQGSMARVAALLPVEGAPILSSPEAAVLRAAATLAKL